MSKKHDFKNEIKKAIHKAWITNNPENFGQAMNFAVDEVMKTTPLRLADRLQSMKDEIENYDPSPYQVCDNITQLMKEVEDGQSNNHIRPTVYRWRTHNMRDNHRCKHML